MPSRGIQTTRYPVIHGFTEYQPLAAMGSLPHAESAAARHCALPLSASTTSSQVEQVVDALREVLAAA